ncbi:MAG: aminopeptidase P family protein [Candidatus Omnitrophica bacterium]|nr:aminopeptidase P family protein [Candidatus Omnitrophota bacterium]
MTNRMQKVRRLLAPYKIDALIVSDAVNATYLTRYPVSESWLFITAKKTYYITDFRYIHEVRAAVKGVTPVMFSKSVFNTIFDLAARHKATHIGINEHHWTVAQHKRLKQACPKGIKLKPANDLVESLREIKEPEEVQAIRDGLEIHREALRLLKRYIKPNITEEAVFAKLEGFVRRRKVGFSFPPIIASGPNSSYPHANVTPRKIRDNEPVLVDMGVCFGGYMTDLTRMFFLGKIANLVQETEAHVREAQRRAIASIKAGMSIAEVDLKARKYLESKNLAKYFGHSLGHGVGLEIHEGPRLFHTIRRPLKAGMVVTVEPAVYFAGKFGIRLEEMVLVTETGCEVLSGHIA